MNSDYKSHLERILVAVDPRNATTTEAEWLTKNTNLGGKSFSFKDHEYQKVLLDDPAQIKYVRKCSQIGISELAIRWVVASTQLYAGINILYVLPSAAFASTFSSTRLASVLDSAPLAKASLFKTDSASIKRFYGESFIYMRGASRSGQAISIPATRIVLDEVDFAEDQDVLSSFKSRMTHADPAIAAEWWFSTPTVPRYGVSHLVENSLQHKELYCCNHCNHEFFPDYYKNVKLPGFNYPSLELKGPASHVNTDRKLEEFGFLSKTLLTKYPINEAFLGCPKCHKPCSQDIKYRKFVTINPDSNFDEHGYDISPFSAPIHVPPPKMIRTSTAYRSVRDFNNNCLGLTHEDSTTGLAKSELEALFYPSIEYPEHPPYQVSGTDMGGTCANLTAYSAPDGHIRIMSAAMIPLHRFKVDYIKSLAEHSVISSVIDLMPYTDLVAEMQSKVPSLFACVFTRTKGVELFNIREKEEDESKASYGVRQVNSKKNALFDHVMNMVRAGKVSFAPSTFSQRDTLIEHMMDMRRIEIKNMDGDSEFVWKKSSAGNDHYFHALAYLVLADFLKGLSTGMAPLPMLVGKFAQKKVL